MNDEHAPSRILIVDDTPANIGVVVEALERYGHRVLVAQGGEECIARAKLVHPDLILLDVMMPWEDGFEVCRRLKSQQQTRDIPVIFMTALSDMNDKVQGFRAGGVDYITKPFQLEEVLARVATHLWLRRMQQRLAAQNAELQGYRDNLEQQVAERTAALRESAERLRMTTHVLNQVHEAVFLIDEDGRFHYVNEEACRKLGYTADELLRMSITDIDPDWPRERCRNIFPTLRVKRFHAETVHHGKDGRAFPVEITSGLIEYEGREYALALARDITERRRAEKALYASEQAFRAVVENSPDNIIRYDTNGRRVYVNPAIVRLLGLPAEQLLGKHPGDPNRLHDPAAYVANIRRAIETRAELVEEHLVHTAEGGLRWCQTRFVPEFGPDGEVASVLAIGRDIDEIKKSEQRFRSLAENIPDQIIRYDAQGRKTYVNSAVARQLGTDADSLLGQTPEAPPVEIRASAIDGIDRLLRTVLETGEPQELELPVRHAEAGQQTHLIRLTAERDEHGRIIGALMVGRDITARIDAEHRLAESYNLLQELTTQRETAREEERKRIAREIHDELGQHLTTLRMGISALRYQFGDGNPAMAASIQEMMALADKTIAVVRNVATALRPAALDGGIGSALEWLASEFERRSGVRCRLQLPQIDVDLDEDRAMALFRIVQESLTNAARHAHATDVEITMTSSDCDCTVEVRDNGCGFAETGIRRSSLGLAGMRERVLMLGGRIAVDSRPGNGTTIRVVIPMHDEEEK